MAQSLFLNPAPRGYLPPSIEVPISVSSVLSVVKKKSPTMGQNGHFNSTPCRTN